MEREWRCKQCDTLLGVERGAQMLLRYKQAQYVGGGEYTVTAICRNCSATNDRTGTQEPP